MYLLLPCCLRNRFWLSNNISFGPNAKLSSLSARSGEHRLLALWAEALVLCLVWMLFFCQDAAIFKIRKETNSQSAPLLVRRIFGPGTYGFKSGAWIFFLSSSRRKAGWTEVEKHVAGASSALWGSLFRFNPAWQWRLSLEHEDCPICLAEDGRTYFSGSNGSGLNGTPLCRLGIAEIRSD